MPNMYKLETIALHWHSELRVSRTIVCASDLVPRVPTRVCKQKSKLTWPVTVTLTLVGYRRRYATLRLRNTTLNIFIASVRHTCLSTFFDSRFTKFSSVDTFWTAWREIWAQKLVRRSWTPIWRSYTKSRKSCWTTVRTTCTWTWWTATLFPIFRSVIR